jgi:hypothetical protein
VWYLFRFSVFVVKNIEKLDKGSNIILNVVYACERSGLQSDDPRLEEFIRKFSAKPDDFKRNFPGGKK